MVLNPVFVVLRVVPRREIEGDSVGEMAARRLFTADVIADVVVVAEGSDAITVAEALRERGEGAAF